MRCAPSFECRLEHIGKYDRVKVECGCGRTVLLPLSAFDGLPRDTHVVDLKRRLRCDSRNEKGHVDVPVVWADYTACSAATACEARDLGSSILG
jgi:hypothetical protein